MTETSGTTERGAGETTFAWCVKEIAKERGLDIEDLELPEASRRALDNHLAGEEDRSVDELCRDVADALGVDWRNGDRDSLDMSIAYCSFLFGEPRRQLSRS